MSPLRSSAGPAVCTNGTLELGGDDLRERGLAEARRPGQQHVVERVAARRSPPRSRPRAARAARAARRSPRAAAGAASGRARPRRRGRASGSRRLGRDAALALTRRPSRAQRVRDQLLGALALGVEQQAVDLGRREAELEQPVARERARGIARASAARLRAHDDRPRRPLLAAHADLLAQLDDDPLGRALADPRDGLEAGRVAGRDRREQLARRRRPRAPRARPSGRPPGRRAASGTGRAPARRRKPYERERVVAHDQVRVQRHLLADGRHVPERLAPRPPAR